MTYAVEDLLNQALRRIAYPTPIGNIMEGSPAARVAVEIYGQVRDNLLGARDWNFARQAATLTLLKTAPVGGYGVTPWTSAYPPVPWIYEYAYPDGCIEVRAVRPTPIFIPEYLPRPNVFITANDTALNAKVILTNLPNAQAVFTGQVNDPAQWQDANFIEALVDALAVQFQQALAPDDAAVKLRLAQGAQAENIASARPG